MPELRDRLQNTLGSAYTLDRELGGGGMSRVFVAKEAALGRTVVVKVLRPDLAEGISSDRFKREILLAAQLQQANIVPVLSAGTTEGLPYYTMPFVEGESLRARLARDGALTIPDVVGILKDVLKALQYAHQRGIVHRDIKPDNVLLSGGTAVVTDFGIAKALSAARAEVPGATLTGIGTSIGTPTYMAPEQAAGDPATDHRADLYALGALAFELLAGRPPFVATSPHKLLAAHMSERAPAVTDYRPDTPPALADAIDRLLAKDPAERPQTANEVLQALDAVSTTPSDAGHDALPGISIATRRQLTRALAIYAAAFIAAALLARAAINLIGLPEWVLPATLVVMALGLPVILFTAFVHHGSRVARTMATTTPGGSLRTSSTLHRIAVNAQPHVSWRRTTMGGVAALLILVLLVTGYMTLRALGIGPAGSLLAAGKLGERERLLVVDFTAPVADSSLGTVVSEAVRTTLAQSRAVSIVPSSFVAGALQRMERPVTSRLDLALGRDLAQREGIRAIVDGAVTPLGRGFIVTARLVSAESGDELASFRQTAADATDLIPAIDKVARQLRGKIGESLKDVRASPSLARVSTASLPALRKFTEGYRANYLEGDYRKAIAAFEEAIHLDTNFASAYRMGATAYSNARLRIGRQDTLRTRAFELRDRLPELERSLVIATHYYSSSGGADRAKAMAALKRVLELDPDDETSVMNLARLYAFRRDYVTAESLYRTSVSRGQATPFTYQNYVVTLIDLGKLDEASRMTSEFAQRFPRHPELPLAEAVVVAARGQFDSLRALCSRMRVHADAQVRVNGSNCLRDVAYMQGKLREGTVYHREAARADSVRTNRTTPLRFELDSSFRSIWYRERMDVGLAMLDRAVARLDSTPLRERPYFALATQYSLAGRPARARAIMARYDTEFRDSVQRRSRWIPTHRALGNIALAEKRYDDAIREFRAADFQYDGQPADCPVCVLPDLAHAYDLAGNADSAVAIFERYLGTRYALRHITGTDTRYLAGTYKRLGELYEARGDRDRAAAYYSKFVELWKDADPDLQPRVQEVRQRLARISADPRG